MYPQKNILKHLESASPRAQSLKEESFYDVMRDSPIFQCSCAMSPLRHIPDTTSQKTKEEPVMSLAHQIPLYMYAHLSSVEPVTI